MQDTQSIELPVSKKTVILKGYVSGLAYQEYTKILSEANKTSFEAPVDQLSNTESVNAASFPPGTKVLLEQDPTAQLKADNKLLELMLVSVDGNNGAGLLNELLELPRSDVEFVTKKVQALLNDGEVKDTNLKVPQA